MRRFLLSLLLVSCTAMADDLSDANKFLAAKQYDKALPLYTKLAKAGNPEAQFRVGEMYWYGDGTAQDLRAARGWFEKAAAAGNADAKESLAALDRRATRGSEIDYWTKGYDGADLRAGQFPRSRPRMPRSRQPARASLPGKPATAALSPISTPPRRWRNAFLPMCST
jgi:TPR repeat protein